ncbi:hypothetical protein ACFO4O_04365 [Glaciecola siphonariae]|uniref:Uncharacterized protein n=1 Tax=Glaciecola siphonariae TaxID=521012 RepID=A0ABV9LSB5_9ALTE
MILPDVFTASTVSLSKTESVQRSVSRGGVIQLGRRTAHETEVKITSPLIKQKDVGALIAFLDDVGTSTPFDVELPLISKLKGSATANMRTRAAATAGSKTLLIDGAQANLMNIVKPNDMFNVSGHSKAYFVGVNMTGNQVNAFNSNGTGQFTLRSSQPLIKNVANNETVNFLTPKITVVRTSDVDLVISVKRSNFVTVSFDAVEFV